ncbi:MAG TPA: heme-binding protein, partial [Reyranella sp.]
MNRLMIAAMVAASFVATPLFAQAPPPPPPYGPAITFDAAKKALAAAEAEAKKNNGPVAIAIVDSAGQLAAFSKMDNTQHASVDIALGKAVT